MKVLDATFRSCADLQELFQPISPDLNALQLSQGSLQGRLQIINLGSFRLTLLETNQALFLSGTRRPQPCTIAIPLGDPRRHEESFRQEVLVVLVGLPLALWLARDTVDFLLLSLPLLLLMCAELANSAIEATVDRVGEEYHELSGRAKDMGSAAVFMAIAMVVLSWSTVGLSIFYFN